MFIGAPTVKYQEIIDIIDTGRPQLPGSTLFQLRNLPFRLFQQPLREFRVRRKDGNILTAVGSAELIEVNGEPCELSVAADITERKFANPRNLTVPVSCVAGGHA